MDLFAGAGGLGLGLEWAGWDIVVANEFEPVFSKTYARNHARTEVICGDILSEDIESRLFDYSGKIDLVAGGPPCQGFSTVGKKEESDPRNRLFWAFLKVVERVDPKFVLFENVSGFKRMYGGRAYRSLIDRLHALGYSTRHGILNALDFGLPQSRHRTFVVGFKKPYEFEFPDPTHSQGDSLFGQSRWLTLEDALSDLPEIGPGGGAAEYASPAKTDYQQRMREGCRVLSGHEAPVHGDRLKHVISLVPPGGSIMDVPLELRPRSYFNNTYARLWWDRPAPTMTRNFGTPSSSRCIHPHHDRGLTTREGARLQGFPDGYSFTGSRQQQNLQIGNAVPPILAEALGRRLISCLETRNRKVV
jgi:DNA (cytosine-5)-methyltransferase 1